MPRPLVIVDVQPCYAANWSRLDEFVKTVNDHDGPVFLLINAEDAGTSPDTVDDCRMFWLEAGMDEDVLDRARIIDKGFGYLRPWMDMGADEDVIVRVLEYMNAQGIHDSRRISAEDLEEILAEDGTDLQEWMVDEPLVTGWIPSRTLDAMQDCLICGGAADECLREVELLMQGSRIRYERMDHLVYRGMEGAPVKSRSYR